jgi:FkbM family methyltransferase
MTTSDWLELLTPRPAASDAVDLLANTGAAFVYGTGTAAREVITALQARGIRLDGVVDTKSQLKEFCGLPVLRPDSYSLSSEDRSSTPLVIGIFNAFVDISTLRERLSNEGWEKVILFEDLHALMPGDLGDRYWLTRREAAASYVSEISSAYDLWADEASRHLYRELWSFRMSGDRSGIVRNETSPQYFPSDIPPWASPLRIVDCGAFDGDTLETIRRLGVNLEAAALFEPDPGNFIKLVEAAKGWPLKQAELLAWPCGLSGKTEILRFSSNNGAASGFSDTGEITVPCVALDDALTGFEPNLIKMDIEGAENEALDGAMRIIFQGRPGLAICVYHRPEDLWQLPAKVASWNLGYQLYLRAHQFNGFDVVLYALPTA